MKNQLLLFVLAFLPIVASANAVEIDGIYYNLVTKTYVAEVTSHPNKYSGSVVIPENITYEGNDYRVTSIGSRAFDGCYNLTSITIPNSVTSIGGSAFYNCSNITSITIPNSVTSLGSAFGHCSALKSITISNSVTSIESHTFWYCTSLTSITIPNSVTSIEHDAFSECSSLTSIIIPTSVTSIGESVFLNCSSLSSITIPNSVTSIGRNAFRGCSSLSSITIPNSVTSIDHRTFEGCTSLTSIIIPNSVTSIESSAFYKCLGLASITIGSNVQSIERSAFANCPNLADVYCYNETVPTTNSYAFQDSYIEYVTLHVPASAVNAYRQVEPWKNFKKIVALDGSTPAAQKCEKPSITYQNGQLKVTCATEGAQFVTEITDVDIKKHYDATISLTATYNVNAYATKPGYEDSDVCSLTLCWIDQAPAISTGTVQVPAAPVIIRNDGGLLTIQGADDGTTISVFNVDGRMVGSTTSQIGEAIVDTNLQPGSIAIIKIGSKSLKFVVK